jgi:hypothetical protein
MAPDFARCLSQLALLVSWFCLFKQTCLGHLYYALNVLAFLASHTAAATKQNFAVAVDQLDLLRGSVVQPLLHEPNLCSAH